MTGPTTKTTDVGAARNTAGAIDHNEPARHAVCDSRTEPQRRANTQAAKEQLRTQATADSNLQQ